MILAQLICLFLAHLSFQTTIIPRGSVGTEEKNVLRETWIGSYTSVTFYPKNIVWTATSRELKTASENLDNNAVAKRNKAKATCT